MKKFFLILIIGLSVQNVGGQTADLTTVASKFLSLLSADVKAQIQFKFEDKERYNWHYVPRYRAGVSLHDLTQPQLDAALNLLKASLSVQGYKKATDVMALESVLREVENRREDDTYRDPKKYFFSVFGTPTENSAWGWRLEGHHISLNFSTVDNVMASATPSFFGSNPATIPSGRRKGEQILKDESALGFSLVNSLSGAQQKKAVINENAYSDILSENKRKASLLTPNGILYSEMNEQQKKTFLSLLDVYVKNYELGFSTTLMNKIKKAGIENLSFAWAGSLRPGKGHYYRIQGPMLLIEFDNTQNNANHIHSVV
ncbi:MAG TPA: DUF3500 domain-containing protein, partial [Chryseolinea sp.]|nr:DUF3500 domain-containing protein [Chryseolinea sp.]